MIKRVDAQISLTKQMRSKQRGIAYLSVMAGTHDSFALPEYLEKEKNEGDMTDFAGCRTLPLQIRFWNKGLLT